MTGCRYSICQAGCHHRTGSDEGSFYTPLVVKLRAHLAILGLEVGHRHRREHKAAEDVVAGRRTPVQPQANATSAGHKAPELPDPPFHRFDGRHHFCAPSRVLSSVVKRKRQQQQHDEGAWQGPRKRVHLRCEGMRRCGPLSCRLIVDTLPPRRIFSCACTSTGGKRSAHRARLPPRSYKPP